MPAKDSRNTGAVATLNPLEFYGRKLYWASAVFRVIGTVYYGLVDPQLDIEYERQVRDSAFALNEIDKMCKNNNIKHINDGHYSPNGNKWVAECIYDYWKGVTRDEDQKTETK